MAGRLSLTRQAPASKLTARVCAVCRKGRGTYCYRLSLELCVFAHPACIAAYRRQEAEAERTNDRTS